jgi:hypothetical protein
VLVHLRVVSPGGLNDVTCAHDFNVAMTCHVISKLQWRKVSPDRVIVEIPHELLVNLQHQELVVEYKGCLLTLVLYLTMTSAGSRSLVIVSAVIIVLLATLFGMCIRGYLHATSRRFSKISAIFFGCMGISLMLEMPQSFWFTLCTSNLGCNHVAYDFAKFLHFIAISGFTFCMGIPICVWSGMITGSEINIFDLNYATLSKTVLHISIALAMVSVVVAGLVFFREYEEVWLGWCFILIVVVSQLLISLTWLCVGISLQRMVATTAVGSPFNKLFSLNVIILLVFLSDLTRAIFTLVLDSVVDFASDEWELFWDQIAVVLVPYCVGNFLLIRLMTASLKHEFHIDSRLLKSSRADSGADTMYLALSPDAFFEYAEVPDDEN